MVKKENIVWNPLKRVASQLKYQENFLLKVSDICCILFCPAKRGTHLFSNVQNKSPFFMCCKKRNPTKFMHMITNFEKTFNI